MSRREEWRDLDADSRAVGIRVLGWSLTTIVVVILVMVALFALTVAWAPWKGQGEAIKTRESGTNRIRAQEEYVQTYNDLLAADRRVDVMWHARRDDPTQVNKTNYTGAVNFCIQLIADYDALGDKYTSADFRPEGYPARVDQLSKTTDCKENRS